MRGKIPTEIAFRKLALRSPIKVQAVHVHTFHLICQLGVWYSSSQPAASLPRPTRAIYINFTTEAKTLSNMQNGAQSWRVYYRLHALTHNSSVRGSGVEALSLLIPMIPHDHYRNLQNDVLTMVSNLHLSCHSPGRLQSRHKVASPQALWASLVGVEENRLAVPTPPRQHLPPQPPPEVLVNCHPIPWDSILSTIQ